MTFTLHRSCLLVDRLDSHSPSECHPGEHPGHSQSDREAFNEQVRHSDQLFQILTDPIVSL